MKFFVALLAFVAVAHASVPRLDGRIVGGRDVDIKDYPYQVSVRIYDQHICGGSIIDSLTILTAGHCVYNMEYSEYSVRVGNTNHRRGVQHIVSEIRLHENYDPNTTNNDMAILKLETPISFNGNSQPIGLQSEDEEVVVGTTAYVSGWGVVLQGSDLTPADLRAVDVAVISNEDCDRMYGYNRIGRNMICALTERHDSCQGDSGGPLVANGKLIGVVSWGYGCANPRYPGVYANVHTMHSWVLKNNY